MPEDGQRHALDIIRGDEIAATDGGGGAAGENEGLSGAGAGTDEEVFALAGGEDDVDGVGEELVTHDNESELLAEGEKFLVLNHGRTAPPASVTSGASRPMVR